LPTQFDDVTKMVSLLIFLKFCPFGIYGNCTDKMTFSDWLAQS